MVGVDSQFRAKPSLQRRIGPLFRTTDADRGLVEIPTLTPNLEAHRLEGESVLLAAETFSTLLHGQLYIDLLAQLQGRRSRHEIVESLAGEHAPLAVQSALVSLASKGYVVSGEYAMDVRMAAYWCTLGVSPRWAEERLSATRVASFGVDGRLTAALEQLGLAVGGQDATLAVVATDDYLDAGHAETNRRHLASGVPWILVKTAGVWPLFGPVFRVGENEPCWACLAHRLRGNREVDNFLRNTSGDAAAITPRAVVPPFADAIRGIAATEIAKWVVLADFASLHSHAISVDSIRLDTERHPVMRRPQCQECGDEALYLPNRPPEPIRLRSSLKPVRNSGGLRSVPPEETVKRYRHLVSPISGVVTELASVTDDADPWLHVYWAGSNLALKSDRLFLLRNSLRTKSSGKGSTSEQARASALCEALERYSGVFHGDEIRLRRRFEDFAEGEAIHPNDVQLYSERQYDTAEQVNALGSRFNYVPTRFDPSVEIDWTPVWSLTAQRHRYLPTSMLFYSSPAENGVIYCGPDSNGCAAGNTLEEAILQGFFELAERDAFACWWYNRIQLPPVDLYSFDDSYIARARDYYASFQRDLWMLDATNDLGIPVFIAVSCRIDKDAEDILFSAGAHFDPHIAALRALCELNQYFGGVRDAGSDGEGYLYDDPECVWWWTNAKLVDHAYLSPAQDEAPRRQSHYAVPDTKDLRDDVELCRSLVEHKGMEFLVLDQTRPDIGIPVAKTIVPGLRHFWARLAPGRLYDVPVEMGWTRTPTPETELNPIAVFI